MNEIIEFSSKEAKLIKSIREKLEVQDAKVRIGNLAADLLNQWRLYSNETGNGLSYSTFCDEFNFSSRVDEEYQSESKLFYSALQAMIAAGDKYATIIANTLSIRNNRQ